MLDKVAKNVSKFPLIRLDGVDITREELAKIETLEGKQIRRLAFTLLCVAKYWDAASDRNNGWVNTSDKEIITDAMTATAIAEAIKAAIAETGHASFTKVDAVPAASEAKDNVLYLVMNADTGFYDIYAKVDTEVVRLDDVSVNLDNYSTTEQMNEAIATAIANKVDKVDGKGLSTEDFTTALKEKLVALPEGAEANYVKSVSDEFTVSAEGKLEVKEVAPAKVTGLPDALAGKVDKVAGKGLSANDYTDEEKEKLGGVEAGANKNLIEIIKLAGAALNISEKAVNIPFAGDTAGVVTSSTGENKVAVAEDGSMEVNSLNMNKLVQSDGDTLILDGGNAAV